jgi:hypothetical protein
VALLAGLLVTVTRDVSAQILDTTPIGPVVIDIRGALPKYGPSDDLAAPYKVAAADFPSTGFGLDVGGHWYPFKWRAITFGLGASLLLSSGRKGPVIEGETIVSGHDVEVGFDAISPQVSFNFGKGNGWSYVSGGLGTSTMTIATETMAAPEDQPGRKTINYGGGARWFSKKHIAFTFDVRFYAVNPQEQIEEQGVVTAPRLTLLVISAGVSFK